MNPKQALKLTKNLADRRWRLNNLYQVVDERGQKVLFRLNAVQDQLLKRLWYFNLVLKSRQLGVTTFFLILMLDACLFEKNVRAGVIAHNREDAESFFKDKVKFAYDNLPASIRAVRPAKSDSARELSFAGSDSAIRVGTSMRGATLHYLHISEFGKICRRYPDKAKEIVTGSLNTVHAGQYVSIESTAEGRAGYFFDFCQEAEKAAKSGSPLTPLDFKFHFFPWHMDPRNELDHEGVVIPQPLVEYFLRLESAESIKLSARKRAWYAKKWSLMGEEMKREHPSTPAEAWEASVEGAYFANQFDRVYSEGRIRRIPIEDIPVHTFWDLGIDDSMTIWFAQFCGPDIRLVDYYEASGEGMGHYAKKLQDLGYLYGEHWGPHDLTQRDLLTGLTRIVRARELGLNFNVVPRVADKAVSIEAARSIFVRCWFDEVRCAQGIKCLENYRKEWNDSLGVYSSRPRHDWACHGADSFQTLAMAVNRIGGAQTMNDQKAREMYNRYAPPRAA